MTKKVSVHIVLKPASINAGGIIASVEYAFDMNNLYLSIHSIFLVIAFLFTYPDIR